MKEKYNEAYLDRLLGSTRDIEKDGYEAGHLLSNEIFQRTVAEYWVELGLKASDLAANPAQAAEAFGESADRVVADLSRMQMLLEGLMERLNDKYVDATHISEESEELDEKEPEDSSTDDIMTQEEFDAFVESFSDEETGSI